VAAAPVGSSSVDEASQEIQHINRCGWVPGHMLARSDGLGAVLDPVEARRSPPTGGLHARDFALAVIASVRFAPAALAQAASAQLPDQAWLTAARPARQLSWASLVWMSIDRRSRRRV
jgi:hypothetical protein